MMSFQEVCWSAISVINLCNLVYILILVCTGIEKEKMKSILLH